MQMFPLLHYFLLIAEICMPSDSAHFKIALELISLKYIPESVFSRIVGMPPEGATDVQEENHIANILFWRVLGVGGYIALPSELQAGF